MMKNKEIGVRIYREWSDMITPLIDKDSKKGFRFINSCIRYTLAVAGVPDFSNDAELQELWERTNARPCDRTTGRDGWLKVWKRKRRIQR